MNHKMELAANEVWQKYNATRDVMVDAEAFKAGFILCHDLLMPLLIEAMPHVMGSHGADHLLDGFRPRRRPIDDLVERLQEVIGE